MMLWVPLILTLKVAAPSRPTARPRASAPKSVAGNQAQTIDTSSKNTYLYQYDSTPAQYQAIKSRAELRPLPPKAEPRRNLYQLGKELAANAWANTVGYVSASYQNRKTVKALKENPASVKHLHIIVPGTAQNIGSHYRRGKDLIKRGEHVYHVHAGHGLVNYRSIDERTNTVFQKLDALKKKTGLSDEAFRGIQKTYQGHSAGGEVGVYMAGDDRVKKYGINRVVSVAGPGGGIEIKTYAQKLMQAVVPGVKKLDPRTSRSERELVATLNSRTPKVPVYAIYGASDELVPPHQVIPYRHATNEAIIYHPNSGHFGTSGQNKAMNNSIDDLVRNIMPQSKYHGKILKYEPAKA